MFHLPSSKSREGTEPAGGCCLTRLLSQGSGQEAHRHEALNQTSEPLPFWKSVQDLFRISQERQMASRKSSLTIGLVIFLAALATPVWGQSTPTAPEVNSGPAVPLVIRLSNLVSDTTTIQVE